MTQAEAVKAVPGIVDADLAGKRARLGAQDGAGAAITDRGASGGVRASCGVLGDRGGVTGD